MQISSLSPQDDWNRQHARVLRFLFDHGGIRSMREDYLRLARATEQELQAPGTSLLLATLRGKPDPFWLERALWPAMVKTLFLLRSIRCTAAKASAAPS
ncbi:hypothetical protein VQ056_02425 [Paenibacillus sp. JTLBN-2024]